MHQKTSQAAPSTTICENQIRDSDLYELKKTARSTSTEKNDSPSTTNCENQISDSDLYELKKAAKSTSTETNYRDQFLNSINNGNYLNNSSNNGDSNVNNAQRYRISINPPKPQLPQFSGRLGERYKLPKSRTNDDDGWNPTRNENDIDEYNEHKNIVNDDSKCPVPIQTKQSFIWVECHGCGTVVECLKTSIALDCPICYGFQPIILCRRVV